MALIHWLLTNSGAQSPRFWIIAFAIKAFHTKHQVLPLPGSVPDMKAQSADYIRLQSVYKAKARQDVAEVLATVRAEERRLGRTDIPTSEAEVEAFCKEAAFVRLFRGERLPVVCSGGSGEFEVAGQDNGSKTGDGLKAISEFIPLLATEERQPTAY
jgi:amyloid beta precursor protein binding protein 1